MDGMDARARIKQYAARAAAFQVVFVLVHFAYDWWPNGLTTFFSGIDESVFQHMKIGFWSWIFMSAGEWAIRRPVAVWDYISSRLLGALLAPFLFTLVWYLGPALVGRMPNDFAEIVVANLSLVVAGLFAQGIQDQVGRVHVPVPLRVACFLAAGLAVFFFVRFTIEPPWVDVFTPPVLHG